MTDGLVRVAESLLAPLVDPASRTFWPGLLAFAVVALLIGRKSLLASLTHRSSRLDLQLYIGRQLLVVLRGAPEVAGAWLVATHLVRFLDGHFGAPEPIAWPAWLVTATFSVTLFVVWDASRWLAHWAFHRVPALWAFHQVHHSAEVLTPLTFHRIHPVESLANQLRGALVTGVLTAAFFFFFREATVDWTLLGVPAAGLLLNAVFGSFRHSHVWFRYPTFLERWFLSPAQHQVHHSAERRHFDSNYGTWLAVWDRLAGTLVIEEAQPARFGLDDRNHGDDLLSAWLGPFKALLPLLLLVALLPGVAHAQDDDSADDEALDTEALEEAAYGGPGEPGMTIIVTEPDGTHHVAGSAYVVGEQDLERFEYDNIEQILAEVPGVNSRSEDGFGLRPNVGIRGANSDRSAKITLMEDGVLLAPAPYAAPAAYYFPMSTRMTAVEVFKGPAATRHGPNTVGGAVNMTTREVPQDGLAYGIDLGGGMRLTGKAHVWVGAGNNRRGVLVEGVHLHSNGFKELDNGGPTGFDRSETMAKGFVAGDTHRVELKLGYAHEKSNETYLGLTAEDLEATPYRRYAGSANGLMVWDRTQAELAWTRKGEAVDVRTVAYHHYMDRSWTKLNGFADGPGLHELLVADPSGGQSAVYLAILKGDEDSTTPEQALRIGTNDRRFSVAGVQTVARWTVVGESVSSQLELGARLHSDTVWREHSEVLHDMTAGELVPTGDAREVNLDSVAHAQAIALHAHEELRFGELHVLPGIRLETVRSDRTDNSESSGAPVTRSTPLPGMAVLFGATDALDVFAGAHRGFSPVSPGQTADVQPEISWNYEAGARLGYAERNVELVGFFNDYKNITGSCTMSGGCTSDAIGQQFNGGKAWVYGVEAVGTWTAWLPKDLTLPITGSYAWTRSSFRTAFDSDFPQFGTVEIGDSLPYVPEHQVAGRISLAHDRGEVSLGVTGRSTLLDEAGARPDPIDGDLPALVLLDAAGSLHLGERVRLYATGTNLTNTSTLTSWRPAGARPSAPVLLMAGVKVRPPTP
ncbi:MAG: TonB-dependent receptor [Proteobacteria bacterium]|nr:TonB-dependent receptor [Pseudomonadota bacterium]